jgi:hypothetical protein
MRATPPADVSLPQFTAVFVTFGALAMFALLQPELTQNLTIGRTKATIWVTSIMLIPALVLYPFRTLSGRVANVSHLCWTFAYLLFLLHAYWAVFVIFDGVVDTVRQMGLLISSVNYVLVLWWGLDVVLLWTVRSTSPAAARFQTGTRAFTFLVFAITLIVLREGPVRILGIVFAAAVILALLLRLWARERRDGYVPTG